MASPPARTNKFPTSTLALPPPSVASTPFPSTFPTRSIIRSAFTLNPTDPPANAGTLFQFSRRALFFFAALLLLPWLVVAVLLLYPRPAPLENDNPYDEYVQPARPGPWGELQYSRLLIEPPDEFTAEDPGLFAAPEWVFQAYTADRLADLWRTARLDAAQIAALHAATTQRPAPADALIVRPPTDLVLGLSPEARAAIYAALSVFPENPAQNEPFRFRADTADEWFENSNVPPATLALVRRLLYRRGNSLLFSDYAVVMPQIASRTERIRLLKTLARKSTLLVKLRVRPTSDLDTLAEYWGHGPRRKDMRALLESIAHRPGGITIDVAHLLPKFPRSVLFTYPPPPVTPADAHHDCHWTSLNFFNDAPDERFTDTDVVRQTLESGYVPVVGRPRLGDILVFARADDVVIHSCVFVADDIVFTKNGASETMPFILMNLSDVIAFYPADPPLVIRAYRARSL